MSYDQKCYDLAESFLRDAANEKDIHPDLVATNAHFLAQDIQQTIEDFLMELKPKP